MKYNKGITLIALVITIIVLVIIAGVSISLIRDGVTEKATYSKYVTEFSDLREGVQLANLNSQFEKVENNETAGVVRRNITQEEYNSLPNNLKYEIMYVRDGCPEEKGPTAAYYSIYELEEDFGDLYYIENDYLAIEAGAYIYDAKTDDYYRTTPMTRRDVEVYGETVLKMSEQDKEIVEQIKQDRGNNNPDVRVEIVAGAENTKIIRVKAVEGANGIDTISLSDGQTSSYENEKGEVIKEFVVSNAGTYSITVNNGGTSTVKTIVVNEVIPTEPVIEVTEGEVGENGWYKSDVKVRITATESSLRLTYQIKGSKIVAETEITSGDVITISESGIYTLTSYTYDISNQRSVKGEITIKIDNERPNDITLASNNIENRNSTGFSINIQGTDNLSGVSKCEYYVGGTKYDIGEITALANYTEYNVYAKVYDNAGNESTTNTITVKTKCPGNLELSCQGARQQVRNCPGSRSSSECRCSTGGNPCVSCGHNHYANGSYCGMRPDPCVHNQINAHTYYVMANCEHGQSAAHSYVQNCIHNSEGEHD